MSTTLEQLLEREIQTVLSSAADSTNANSLPASYWPCAGHWQRCAGVVGGKLAVIFANLRPTERPCYHDLRTRSAARLKP